MRKEKRERKTNNVETDGRGIKRSMFNFLSFNYACILPTNAPWKSCMFQSVGWDVNGWEHIQPSQGSRPG